MPKELQVGLTCYTDWPGVEQLQPRQHNATTIRQGNPDLVCGFDYVRYRRPQVPGDLQNQPLSDPNTISDERLLSFLGASVDQ